MSDKRTPGRPPVSGESRSTRIVVRVTPEERDRYHATALAAGIDLAELVRRLLTAAGEGE